MTRFFTAMAPVIFCLTASAAIAGEWREAPPPPADMSPEPYAPMRALRYFSDKLAPGESVNIAVTPLLRYKGNFLPDSFSRKAYPPEDHLFVLMRLVLTSGNDPITGFDGVATYPARDNRDWISFYDPRDKDGKPLGTGQCAGYVQQWEYSFSPKCEHSCYRTLDDLKRESNAVGCESGLGYWIEIRIVREIGGFAQFEYPQAPADPDNRDSKWVYDLKVKAHNAQLLEIGDAFRRGGPPYLFERRVESSSRLVVKIRHGQWTSMDLTLDDAFRQTLFHRN